MLMDYHLSCKSRNVREVPRDLIDAVTLEELRLDRMSVDGQAAAAWNKLGHCRMCRRQGFIACQLPRLLSACS